MDSQNSLLSHQQELVLALSNNFSNVTVVTGSLGDFDCPENTRVLNTNWIPGRTFNNLRNFYSLVLPIVWKSEFDSVFFHMTDLQCALISPLFWLKRKKQILWYAHKHKSKFLIWSSIWVTTIVTSTKGSCPVKSRKVVAIGQAINPKLFSPIQKNKLNLNRLIHIGRFDKSKNIDLLVEQAKIIRSEFPDLNLLLVGSPGNNESKMWAHDLVKANESNTRWLQFQEAIPRTEFAQFMKLNGVFFHAYLGSLDKTLVESTMLRIPVVTINPEYLSIFGAWGEGIPATLLDEYSALRRSSEQEISDELDRRLRIALTDHSIGNWVTQITALLR